MIGVVVTEADIRYPVINSRITLKNKNVSTMNENIQYIHSELLKESPAELIGKCLLDINIYNTRNTAGFE